MRWRSRFAPLTLTMCVIALQGTGCSGGSSSSPPDPTTPRVSSSSPGDADTGVSIGASITVTFDVPLNPATVGAATVTVKDSGGHAVAGTASGAGSTVTFTPASSLSYLTTYTVTLTTGITDVAGNALAGNHVLRFTTETTPSPLIDAATLRGWVENGAVNRAGDDKVVVLDVGSSTYGTTGHIPGAQAVNGTTDIYQNRKEGPAVDVNMVLDGATMDALVRSRGIDDSTTVVITTSASSILNVTRVYWMFRYWGFPKEKLKVLDGMNGAWDPAGLVTAAPTITPSTYSVKSNAAGLRSELRASLKEMMDVVQDTDPNTVILDARTSFLTTGVFNPQTLPTDYTVFEGHMKGAQLLPYTDLYDGTTFHFKSAGELATMFNAVGIDDTKTTYVHCRTGVIASVPFFVLDAILGWRAVDYDGSWSQWGQLSDVLTNGGQLSAGSPWRTDIDTFTTGITYNHDYPRAVEILTVDGAACTGTFATDGTTTYSSGCTPVAPDESPGVTGNEIETEDAAYLAG